MKGRHGNFLCQICGNLNFISRREKGKNENNCQKCLKHKCTYGWVHTPGNDLVITYLPIVTRPPNRCFSPLSFLSFLSWPLLTSNVFNVGSSYVKGRYGKFVCEMSGNLNFASRQGKTENGNNC